MLGLQALPQPSVVEAPKAAAPAAAVSATPEPVAVVSGDGRLKSSPAARRLASEIGVAIAGLAGSGPGGRIVEADVRQASLQSGASTGSARQENVETKVNASPLARRLAAERGIDLSQIKGSGPQGRIVQGDLDQAPLTSGRAAPVQTGPTAGSTVPVRGMRKTIAQRMHQSLQTSAQLSMDMTAQMDDAVRLRGQLIKEWDGEARPTYTDLVIKAVAKALGQHPMMNSRFDDTEITLLREIHMGLAVSVPEGLLVPVIRNVHELNLKQIAQESARLAAAARAGTLGLDDYAGGTFTISALGMFGVNSFTPIINQPQTGILGVNQLFDGLTWDEDKPIKTKQMNLSLTWDHRAVDGAPAAEFLASVVEFLSEPYRLLL